MSAIPMTRSKQAAGAFEGYFDAVMEAQLNIMEQNIVEPMLTTNILVEQNSAGIFSAGKIRGSFSIWADFSRRPCLDSRLQRSSGEER